MIRDLRHQKIIELVAQKQGITVRELTRLLNVSTMTVHRDLSALEASGLIQRVHGGVVTARRSESRKEICGYCGKECPSRTRLTFFSDSGETVFACCVHCGMGLMHRERGLNAGLGVDFLYETVVDLPRGYYLLESQIRICCTPSALVFADRRDAERMQKGFGGKLLDFAELRNGFAAMAAAHSAPSGGEESTD